MLLLTKEEIEERAKIITIGILKEEVSVKDQEVFELFQLMFNNLYESLLKSFAPKGSSLNDYCYTCDEDKDLYASQTLPVNFLRGPSASEALSGDNLDFNRFLPVLINQNKSVPPGELRRINHDSELKEKYARIFKDSGDEVRLIFFYAYFGCISSAIDLAIEGYLWSRSSIAFSRLSKRGEIKFKYEEFLNAITAKDYTLKPDRSSGDIATLLGFEKPRREFAVSFDWRGVGSLRLGFVSRFSCEDILASTRNFPVSVEVQELESLIDAQNGTTLFLIANGERRGVGVKIEVLKLNILQNKYGTFYYGKMLLA